MSTRVCLQDLFAGFVAVVLVVGSVICAVLEEPIPAELSAPTAAAVTWLFMRSAQQSVSRPADIVPRAP